MTFNRDFLSPDDLSLIFDHIEAAKAHSRTVWRVARYVHGIEELTTKIEQELDDADAILLRVGK